MNKYIPLLVWYCLLCIGLSACSNKEISERVALSEVTNFIENNPVFETGEMDYGEVKFSKKNDAEMLSNYRKLQKEGYITMELLKERKRFLSKDSSFTYLIELADKSIPFVVEKNENRAQVKSYIFKLDDSQAMQLQKSGRSKAKATVTLSRQETDFAPFAPKTKGANASFIRKTYTLKFDDEAGWEVSK